MFGPAPASGVGHSAASGSCASAHDIGQCAGLMLGTSSVRLCLSGAIAMSGRPVENRLRSYWNMSISVIR